MSELSEQEQIRRQSLDKLREMGINPYPADEYVVTSWSTDIKEMFERLEPALREAVEAGGTPEYPEVSIAGRMMSRRIMGKASFIELQDSKGRIQCYISRDDISTEQIGRAHV